MLRVLITQCYCCIMGRIQLLHNTKFGRRWPKQNGQLHIPRGWFRPIVITVTSSLKLKRPLRLKRVIVREPGSRHQFRLWAPWKFCAPPSAAAAETAAASGDEAPPVLRSGLECECCQTCNEAWPGPRCAAPSSAVTRPAKAPEPGFHRPRSTLPEGDAWPGVRSVLCSCSFARKEKARALVLTGCSASRHPISVSN